MEKKWIPLLFSGLEAAGILWLVPILYHFYLCFPFRKILVLNTGPFQTGTQFNHFCQGLFASKEMYPQVPAIRRWTSLGVIILLTTGNLSFQRFDECYTSSPGRTGPEEALSHQ